MKRLSIFIFFLIMTFHGAADEVGNTTFVTEPKAEPLFTSKNSVPFASLNALYGLRLRMEGKTGAGFIANKNLAL
jgi:hypothetical protein